MNLGRVFVDTGAWLALQAKVLATSNHVVGETYTLLRLTRGYAPASRFLDWLAQTRRLERHFIAQDLEREACQILQRYAEHPFSLVDATSFALLRRERIRYAFAFDAHFATAGFPRIPVDLSLPA